MQISCIMRNSPARSHPASRASSGRTRGHGHLSGAVGPSGRSSSLPRSSPWRPCRDPTSSVTCSGREMPTIARCARPFTACGPGRPWPPWSSFPLSSSSGPLRSGGSLQSQPSRFPPPHLAPLRLSPDPPNHGHDTTSPIQASRRQGGATSFPRPVTIGGSRWPVIGSPLPSWSLARFSP